MPRRNSRRFARTAWSSRARPFLYADRKAGADTSYFFSGTLTLLPPFRLTSGTARRSTSVLEACGGPRGRECRVVPWVRGFSLHQRKHWWQTFFARVRGF